MRLAHAMARGFKCHDDLNINIPPLLAIFGPNGSGKTAVHQTIRIGMQGYDTEESGKRLQDVRELLSGDEADLALSFDNSFGIRRLVGRSLETRVAPPRGETTEKAAQSRIDEETGSFALSFDLLAYLRKSPEKRKEQLFAMLPREKTVLTEDLWHTWLGYAESDEVLKRAIDHLWTGCVIQHSSAVDGLAAALEAARLKMNEAEMQRRNQETITVAADRDAARSSAEVVTFDPAGLTHLQSQLSVIEQRIGELKERIQFADRVRRQNAELTSRLERLETLDRELNQRARESVERFDELSRDVPNLPTLEAAWGAAQTASRTGFEAKSNAASALFMIQAEIRAAEQKLAALGSEPTCHVCGSVGQIEAIRSSFRGDIAELRQRESVGVDHARETEAAMRSLDTAENDARRDVEAARNKIAAMQTLEVSVESTRTAIARNESELLRLRNTAPDPVPVVKAELLTSLDNEAADIRALIRQQQELAEAAGAARADRERADKQRTLLDQLTERAQKLKTLHAALQRLRAHVIEQMVAPIEHQANEILQQIDPAKTFRFQFERENRPVMEFGFEEAGTFRTFKAASKGEDMFLAVVFVIAMIAEVQPNWRVLMIDDAEGIDKQRLKFLMLTLAQCRHLIDNVIISSCRSIPEIEGWTILDAESWQPMYIGAEDQQLALV